MPLGSQESKMAICNLLNNHCIYGLCWGNLFNRTPVVGVLFFRRYTTAHTMSDTRLEQPSYPAFEWCIFKAHHSTQNIPGLSKKGNLDLTDFPPDFTFSHWCFSAFKTFLEWKSIIDVSLVIGPSVWGQLRWGRWVSGVFGRCVCTFWKERMVVENKVAGRTRKAIKKANAYDTSLSQQKPAKSLSRVLLRGCWREDSFGPRIENEHRFSSLV